MAKVITSILGKRSDFFWQTLLSFFVRGLGAVAAFIASLVVGRMLGAHEAGLFFLAFSMVTFLAAFSRVGLDNSVLRFVGAAYSEGDWGLVRNMLKKSILLTAVMSALVMLLVVVASGFLAGNVFNNAGLKSVLVAMSPAIGAVALFTLFALGLQALRKIVLSVLVLNILVNGFLVLALLVLDIRDARLAAIVFSVSACMTVAIGGYFTWRSLMPGTGELEWRELVRSCLPLWVVVLMGQLTQWSGQFIAGAWVDMQSVAQLAVAQRTALLTSFILMAVNMVAAPRFAALYKQGKQAELQALALKSVKMMVLIALPVLAVMLVFPAELMSLFGEGFHEGAHLLQILAIGQFVSVVSGSVGYLLTMSGHEKDFRNTVLVSGPLAVGVALLLVPTLGATGSAIATAIAVGAQNLIAVWLVRKRLGFSTLSVWQR